jgi:hypothetical protein
MLSWLNRAAKERWILRRIVDLKRSLLLYSREQVGCSDLCAYTFLFVNIFSCLKQQVESTMNWGSILPLRRTS